jgi:O-antigen/teichoic acid export membrane protein
MNIKRNYFYNVSYQLLCLLTPLITTPYISRVLGADGIGKYSFLFSIVTYFLTVAAMGTASYGQREISYRQDDKAAYSVVFWNTELFSCISTIFCFLAFLVYVKINNNDVFMYLIMSLHIIAVAFDITWFFQGLEEFKIIVIRNTIIKIATILFTFLFVKTKNDLWLYALGLSGGTLLSAISMWTYLPKYIDKMDKNYLHPFTVFKGSFVLFLPAIATTLYSFLDKTMIGVMTNSSYENGYYEQASKIVKMVMTIITSMGTVMMPKIGFYFQKGNKEQVDQYMYRSYRFTWFVGLPLCFGVIAISKSFVPWFFGAGYDKVSELLWSLSFLIPIIGVSTITGVQYMIPTKQQKNYNITIFVGLCTNFCLNYLLIPVLLSNGASIASVAAETSIMLLQLYFIRDQLSVKKIFSSALPYLIASIVMGGVIFLVSTFLHATIINTLILIVIGISLYGLILYLIHDEMFNYAVNILFKKLKKKKGKADEI